VGRVELTLAPRHATDAGLDRRAAPLPPGLLRAGRGHLVVAIEGRGAEPPLGLAVALPRPAEFFPSGGEPPPEGAAWGGPRDPAGDLAGGSGPAGLDRPAGAERVVPAAPALLAAGLALVFAGAALGRFAARVQAPATSRR
jgi:hypothetical protein